MSVTTTDQSTTSGSEHFQGRVKWFNNKAGYGFITVSDNRFGGDIFVHHSSLSVSEEQYKYLVQGEYVEFEMSRIEGGQHEWQASNVRGCNGGQLMCETRREVRSTRTPNVNVSYPEEETHRPVAGARRSYADTVRPPRRVSSGDSVRPPHQVHSDDTRTVVPRHVSQASSGDEGVEWMLVRRRPPTTRPAHRPRPRPRSQQSSQPRVDQD
jgi:cold shock CspA family protein